MDDNTRQESFFFSLKSYSFMSIKKKYLKVDGLIGSKNRPPSNLWVQNMIHFKLWDNLVAKCAFQLILRKSFLMFKTYYKIFFNG